jgi:glycosyltransferase involved in cell wall biosynthesis
MNEREAKLFSIVLLHYKQQEFINTALSSILAQSHPNIELIVIDDASGDFAESEVLSFIESRPRNSIANLEVLVNEKNIGTTKTINKALRRCHGEYILFFAADDSLFDSNVIANYVSAFEALGPDAGIVTGLTMKCDSELKPTGVYYSPPQLMSELNSLSAIQQFEFITQSSIVSMGATCVRRSVYEKHSFLDERYTYVEDWPFFLRYTRSGVKIHTQSFTSLLYRAGGISDTSWAVKSHRSIIYHVDVIRVMENEILPFLSLLPLNRQNEIFDSYLLRHKNYRSHGGTESPIRLRTLFRFSPRLVFFRAYRELKKRKLLRQKGGK